MCGAALVAPSAALAAPKATVSISGVSGATFHITHGTGWEWPITGVGCTATAHATLGTGSKGVVTNRFPAGAMWGHHTATLQFTGASGRKVKSISAISAKCNLRRDYIGTAKAGSVLVIRHQGGSQTTRTVTPYRSGGKCTWKGDGQRGALSTCLYAHTAIAYEFRLPSKSTLRSVGHTVIGASRPCRNKSWQVGHAGSTYRLTFQHGAKTRYSQCDILGVHVNYTRTVSTKVTKWHYTTASTNWS